MSFLQPGLLAILAPLVFLPLIIHLLSRRVSRPLHFPSVQHLKVSVTRSAALYRWRHWLFLLLRTLLIALIIMAFLRPVYHRHGASTGEAERVVLILIDNSLSMEHRHGGQTPRDRAIGEAERILGTLREGDRVNVLRIGDVTVSAFPRPSEDSARARQFITELAAGVGRADFSRANRQVAGMGGVDTEIEIYYLSDFQRSNWASVDFRPLSERARIFFVDVGAPERGNRALTDLRLEGETVAGSLVTLDVEVSNFSETGREESIQLLLDGRPVARQSVFVAPYSQARTRIPLAFPEEGKHLIELQIEADALPLDDRFFAVIEVVEKEEVLLLTAADPTTESGADYLEAALNPFFGTIGSIRPRRVTPEALSQADLASVTKLFISEAGPMDTDRLSLLQDFLFSGGGVVWFLDSVADAENLRQLGRTLGDRGAALQLGSWRESETLAGAQQVIRGDFDSPFLRIFAGTRRQDLGRLEVYDSFAAARGGEGGELLTYADGTPAMILQDHGLGQLLLLNLSAHPQRSNLANQRFFPVWIQSMVESFQSDRERPHFLNVGGRVVTSLWRDDVRNSQFLNPSGDTIRADVEVVGARASVSFPAQAIGVYHLSRQGELVAAFAVNPPAEEADLRPIDLNTLPDRAGTPRQTTLMRDSATDFERAALGYPLFHWFIGAALFCAFLELALHLLVRRYAPTVVLAE